MAIPLIDSRAWQRWAFITGVAHHDDRDLFWWIGLSIVVAVAANTRGRSPIAWFIYAIIFSPLLGGLLLLALPNLANSFAAGRMYLEGELRELEERRRRRDCRADCGRRGRADGDRGVDDARVVRGGSYFLRPIDAAALG